LGIEAVATYAVALSILQFVRTFCSIVYSPYASRYNHFVGLSDYAGLIHFVRKMIILFAPILIIPILTLSLTAKPFVISWVGGQYVESSFLVSFLVLTFIFNFIKDPANAYLVATERNNILVIYNIIVPIAFWAGVAALIGVLNTRAFAIMKFVAPGVNVAAYWLLMTKDFKNRGFDFLTIGKLLKNIIPTILIVMVSSWIFSRWMIAEHSSQALLINLTLMACAMVISMLATIPFNDEMKLETVRYYNSLKIKLRK
jgi:O-antigen/teichoic acid export membrane protein